MRNPGVERRGQQIAHSVGAALVTGGEQRAEQRTVDPDAERDSSRCRLSANPTAASWAYLSGDGIAHPEAARQAAAETHSSQVKAYATPR